MAEATNKLPRRFAVLLENVAIVIEDTPSKEQRKKLTLHRSDLLYGLYEGVPKTKREVGYSFPPDKITIFRRAIVSECKNEADVRRVVLETVMHEIGHHLGMNEFDARKAGKRRVRLIESAVLGL